MENMNNLEIVGQLQLAPHQNTLLEKFADIILNGTVQQAIEAYEIIFETPVKDEFELQVFKALCEQKIKERDDNDYGIKGVIRGGGH